MNLTKLAQLANVSVSTVSKALSDNPEISEATKKHIIEIAKANGCYEKYYKPKYPHKLIAVICPEILGNHYGKMATYMEKEISEYDGTMVLSVSNFSPKKQEELIEYYTKYAHADGVIVIEPASKIKNTTDVPIVQIGFENESRDTDCVKAEIGPAMEEAVRYLRSLGHKKIGFIGEELARPEHEAFIKVMKRMFIPTDSAHVIVSQRRFEDAGYQAMDEMLKRNDLPTVIFAAYSHIALGILQRLNEASIRVPEDISLICMDDILPIPYSDRELSCIRMHLDELSATAIDLLYQKIRRSYVKTKHSVSVIRQFSPGQTVGRTR